MARRKEYKAQSFESAKGRGDSFSTVYESMLVSDAWKSLTKNQCLLYVYLKAQYYGKRKPSKDYPDVEAVQSDRCFYFPIGTAERYGLYKRSNHQAFYKDMQALEQYGFIETVINGKATKSKSVYRYSDRWQDLKS